MKNRVGAGIFLRRRNFMKNGMGAGIWAGVWGVMVLVTGCPSPVVGTEAGEAVYAITVRNSANGTVSAGRETAGEGEVVSLALAPDAGYAPASVRVTGVREVVVDGRGNTRTFTMPAEDVTVFAVFAAVPKGPGEPELPVAYDVTVHEMEGGTFDVEADSPYADSVVRLIARPDPGKKYRPGSLKVRGGDSGAEVKTTPEEDGATEWTFTMPCEDVAVDAGFIDEETALYAIIITQPVNGSIACDQHNAVAGDTVTLTLLPQDEDYRYRPGSLAATPALEFTGRGGGVWSFTMPEEPVGITAEFEEIPSYAVAVPDWGKNAQMTVSPLAGRAVREGKPVTVTLTIADPANYRYRDGSISVTAASGGGAVPFAADGDFRWAFVMPAEDVTVNAVIEFIPYFDIVLTGGAEGGSLSVTGVAANGPYEGKAREGTPITVTAMPAPGYKLTDGGLSVTPAGAVTFTRAEGQPEWTFVMPGAGLEIGVEFIELGPLEIYKGGARKGITAGALSDDSTMRYYKDTVDLDAQAPGRNGNQRVIKIAPALNDKGNAAQQSFSLFSDTEIDLDNAVALSLWAKANKSLNIKFWGFGDADPHKRVVYTGENNNQSIAIGAEWKHYIIPLPVSPNGQTATRVFFLSGLIGKDNYVYIDELEFVQTGVTLTNITIADANDSLLYGATDAEKILTGSPLKLEYLCDDGTTAALRNATSDYTVFYNLAHWLKPFIEVSGDVTFLDGVITPREKGAGSALTLSLDIDGITSNSMTARITDGLLLDDFEDFVNFTKKSIPSAPAGETGYLWYNLGNSPAVVMRDSFTVASAEIHSGLYAGTWRTTATANNPRGGRNFDAKDAAGYHTLTFHIRVTAGTTASSNFQENTRFSFELKNGGSLTNKTTGNFIPQQFTYNPDNANGWQEVTMPLADFAALGLDITAITGYAFTVVDNRGAGLRISLDDIALVP